MTDHWRLVLAVNHPGADNDHSSDKEHRTSPDSARQVTATGARSRKKLKTWRDAAILIEDGMISEITCDGRLPGRHDDRPASRRCGAALQRLGILCRR